MIFENVELQNVAEVKDGPTGGVCFQRVPDSVRRHLNEGAQSRVLAPACGEIRFVSDGPTARVTLSAVEGALKVVPFFGQFRHGEPMVVGPEPKTIELTMPENFLNWLPELEARDSAFSPRVCRLMLWGSQPCFHGVEGDGVRPPVARRLGADLLNFGMGGACQCEPEFADWVASRDDWHIATLALSVNMMGFTHDEFRKRVTYTVNAVAGSNHDRPVACITLYPYFGDREFLGDGDEAKADDFREILREVVAACPHPNVTLLEGREMLTDFAGLTTDLIHPADDGMIQMGENIARRLLPLLARIPRES